MSIVISDRASLSEIIEKIKDNVISVGDLKAVYCIKEYVEEILSGNCALLIDGSIEIVVIGTAEQKTRSIDEPSTESVVRGPRDGFIENLRTNTSLIRKRLKDPNLRLISYKIGRRSKKDLLVVYINGITDEQLVEEVQRRINRIDIDDVPESGYVEQLIEDNYWSPFPQAQTTERPDKVVSALLEGKVAIMLDGTPFVLTVPVTFSMLIHLCRVLRNGR